MVSLLITGLFSIELNLINTCQIQGYHIAVSCPPLMRNYFISRTRHHILLALTIGRKRWTRPTSVRKGSIRPSVSWCLRDSWGLLARHSLIWCQYSVSYSIRFSVLYSVLLSLWKRTVWMTSVFIIFMLRVAILFPWGPGIYLSLHVTQFRDLSHSTDSLHSLIKSYDIKILSLRCTALCFMTFMVLWEMSSEHQLQRKSTSDKFELFFSQCWWIASITYIFYY